MQADRPVTWFDLVAVGISISVLLAPLVFAVIRPDSQLSNTIFHGMGLVGFYVISYSGLLGLARFLDRRKIPRSGSWLRQRVFK